MAWQLIFGLTRDLPTLLGLAVALSVVMYVVMDGFDLGVGILLMFAPSDTDRDVMMNSIAPFCDGNETWLVLGGTLLIAAFPLAYAALLPGFYIPIVTMLFALIFRGTGVRVSFPREPVPLAVGLGVQRRLGARRILPGRHPRRFHRWNSGRKRLLCVRHIRFRQPVLGCLRSGRRRRLCLARRHLVDFADRRNDGKLRAHDLAHCVVRDARLHCGGQHLDAAHPQRDCAALVWLAQHRLAQPGADRNRIGRLRDLAVGERPA
jgi:hypothetical protein